MFTVTYFQTNITQTGFHDVLMARLFGQVSSKTNIARQFLRLVGGRSVFERSPVFPFLDGTAHQSCTALDRARRQRYSANSGCLS